MFTVGDTLHAAADDGRTVCVVQVRRAGELWAIVYGPTEPEALRRVRLAVRALNRERDLN